VTTKPAAWYGYRAAKKRPRTSSAVASRWSGSGGFLWPVCRCSHPAHGNAALGAVSGFGNRPERLFSPGTGRSQLLDVLEVQGPEQSGPILAWNGGRDSPGWQARPSRLGLWLLTLHGRLARNSSDDLAGTTVRWLSPAHRWSDAILMGLQPASSADAPVISWP